MLNIRAGGFRRQRLLSRCNEPFVFHGAASTAYPMQVDVLVPAATSGQLGPLGSGEHRLDLHPLTGVGPAGTSSGSRDPAAATAAATGSAECPGTTGTTVTAETTAMHVKLRVQEATCL